MQRMRTFLCVFGVAILFLSVDIVVDYVFFYDTSLWGVIIADMPPTEIFMRCSGFLLFFVLGAIVCRIMRGIKRAEKALRDSEYRYRTLVENQVDALCRWLPDTTLTFVNEGYCRVFGKTREELLGQKWLSFLTEKAEERVQVLLEGLRVDPKTYTYVHESIGAEGGILSQEWTDCPIFDADGRLVEFQSVGRDITESKRAQEAELRQKEIAEKYLDVAGVMIIALNAEGEISLINQKGCEILECKEEEAIGKNWFDNFLPEGVRSEVKIIFRDLMEGRIDLHEYVENTVLTAKGNERMVAWHNALLTDEKGNVVGTLTSGEDITESRRAEEALKEAYDIVNRSPAVAFLWRNADGWPVEFVSENVETVFGYTSEEFVSGTTSYAGVVYPEDLERVSEEVKQFSKDGDRVEFTHEPYRIVRPNGEIRWIDDRTYIRRDEKGEITHFQGIVMDITERKRAEEEHLQLEARVQHAQKLESLGVLAGGIAHDFNNLLVGVLGNADMALSQMAPGAIGRSSVEQIEVAAKRAAELTMQMLAYSGRGRFFTEAINLSSVVEETTHLLNISISKKVVLRYELDDDLPAIEGDPVQVRQIIMNLVINASEAIGDESGVISVDTGVMECGRDYLAETYVADQLPEGAYVYVEVSDTGCGMDEETKAKIFDPFFTTKFTGRGLGLAAAVGIVRAHHGAIKVHSEPGRGTSFKILFPRSNRVVSKEEPDVVAVEEQVAGGTILVADDEEIVRKLATQMLEHSGFRVMTAIDGREAVEMFGKHIDEIQVVVLDMTMPHMGGTEVFREIRRLKSNVNVILSSGYSKDEVTSRFADEDLSGFIQKPYKMADLVSRVREAISK